MSARARRDGRYADRKASARPANPWLVRGIVVVAVLVVAAGLVVTIATGTLFTAPGR